MRTEYDFSTVRKNPYAKKLQRQVTIRLDVTSVEYFRRLAAEMGMPYQNLINLFLRDCAAKEKKPVMDWLPAAPKPGSAWGGK